MLKNLLTIGLPVLIALVVYDKFLKKMLNKDEAQ
jgi:hypothetical protein